ncbi:unnamed protein product [Closterium sp. NIES-54]
MMALSRLEPRGPLPLGLPSARCSWPPGPSAPAAATATTAATAAPAATATTATTTAAPTCCATMALLRVLVFDHEGRPINFDTWLDDLQLYLLSDSKDNVSLFDHTYGTAPAPPATANSETRSQWLTLDAAARLAIRNHLPLAECAHFGQHRTTQALYDAVVSCYSSPATAALGRLLLPYLFPEQSAFATVEDLVSRLHTSDACYQATIPAEFLDKNQPPMFITLYFKVTRLPNSLRSVRDRFLSFDPTSLTVDLLEEHLLASETSAVAASAARGTPRTPFIEGCSPSPLAPSYASAATADVPGAEDVGDVFAGAKCRSSKGKGSRGGGEGSGSGGGGSIGGSGGSGGCGSGGSGGGSGGVGGGNGGSGGSGGSGSGGTGGGRTGARRGGFGGGQRQQQQRRRETQSPQQLREWLFQRGTSGVSDSCPYVIRTGDRAGQTCGRLHTQHHCFSRLDDAWHAEFGDEVERPRRSHVAPPCLCCLLSHQNLLWHHRLGHPSLPRLRGMHSRLLVSGLPRSLPPLLPSPAPPCLPCVQGRQRAAPHSSSFPPTSAPLQTLHKDVWGPACVTGEGHECYFLLVVDDYTRYTTVFPLRSKGQVVDVLIPWMRTVRLQLRERFIMEVARTSMIHAAAPHFLWPFAVQYVAHQLNLWPRVSSPETSPTLRWTGQVGDASVLRVFGSSAFVRDTTADKLSACAIHCDVMFDESVPFYRLFPYRSAPPPPPPLFLAPGPPPVDPLSPQDPAPSGTSQVDPLPGIVPVEIVGDSGATRGAASGGTEPGGAEPGGAEFEGVGSGGSEPGRPGPGGVERAGVEPRGAKPEGVEPGGAESEGAELSPQQLHEWLVRRRCLWGGATAAGGAGAIGAGGAGVTTGAGGTEGTAATGHGGARTRGTRAAGTGGVGDAGARDPSEPRAAGAGGSSAGGARAGGAGAGGTGTGGAGAGVGGTGARGVGAIGAGAVCPRDTVRPRTYFVPLLQQPASPLPAPSPYTEQSGGLTERPEPASRPVSHDRSACRFPRSRPPLVPGTHTMALRPSSVPLRVPLPAPPESSLPAIPAPESDRARTASPTVSRLLATAVTDPSFETAVASALITELLDFAAACRLDYATVLVAESESASSPSVEGECALCTDVLEDVAMDAEMASWKSTGTYVDEVPPPEANIVDGMWIFRVKASWHDTLRNTLVALGFAPSTADPSLFLRTDTLLPPFYILVYVDDLVFATADTEALTLVKYELQKSHTCTDLGELRSYLGLQITQDRARRTITLTQSHMVHQVLQRFGFQFSSPQSPPLSTGLSLSAPPSDEFVEPSGS